MPDTALHSDIATQQSREMTADGEPQARSAILSRRAAIDLMKFLEDSLQRLRGYAYPIPVSATAIVISSPRLVARILTEPFSVNLTALLSRLVRI